LSCVDRAHLPWVGKLHSGAAGASDPFGRPPQAARISFRGNVLPRQMARAAKVFRFISQNFAAIIVAVRHNPIEADVREFFWSLVDKNGPLARPNDRRQIEVLALAWFGHRSRLWSIQGWR
jgi:hypothetical protein